MNALAETQINLTQYQERLGLHLRNPEHEAAPKNLDERRLGVYRELVFNNIEGQLSSSFPVIKSILSNEQWLDLCRAFLTDYRAQTPYFPMLSKEFVEFLAVQLDRSDVSTYPAFLLELAHYERAEIDLFMEDEMHDCSMLSEKSLLVSKLGMASATELVAYAFPVHQISPDYQPDLAPDSRTLLLLFQDQEGDVRFFQLQPLAYHLVSMIRDNNEQTGIEMLQALATNLNLEFSDIFVNQGLQLLKQLNQLNVLRTI